MPVARDAAAGGGAAAERGDGGDATAIVAQFRMFCTALEHQRRGYGGALLERVVDEASDDVCFRRVACLEPHEEVTVDVRVVDEASDDVHFRRVACLEPHEEVTVDARVVGEGRRAGARALWCTARVEQAGYYRKFGLAEVRGPSQRLAVTHRRSEVACSPRFEIETARAIYRRCDGLRGRVSRFRRGASDVALARRGRAPRVTTAAHPTTTTTTTATKARRATARQPSPPPLLSYPPSPPITTTAVTVATTATITTVTMMTPSLHLEWRTDDDHPPPPSPSRAR